MAGEENAKVGPGPRSDDTPVKPPCGWWKIWTRPWMRTPVPRSLRQAGSASIKLGLQPAGFSEAAYSPPFLPNLPSFLIHPSPSRTRAAHAQSVPWPSPSFFETRDVDCTRRAKEILRYTRIRHSLDSRIACSSVITRKWFFNTKFFMASYSHGGAKSPPRLKGWFRKWTRDLLPLQSSPFDRRCNSQVS